MGDDSDLTLPEEQKVQVQLQFFTSRLFIFFYILVFFTKSKKLTGSLKTPPGRSFPVSEMLQSVGMKKWCQSMPVLDD